MKIYNNDYEEERLYSTGSDELDDLLERAFCEGYEYAQREFNSKASKELNNAYFEAVGKYEAPKNIGAGETNKVAGRRYLNDQYLRNPNVDELAGKQRAKADFRAFEKLKRAPKGTGDKMYQDLLKKRLKEKYGTPQRADKFANKVVKRLVK